MSRKISRVLALALFSAALSANAATIVITNAKIATQTEAGVIDDATVVVTDGEISYVGASAAAPSAGGDAQTVDAEGKWLTPGLIVSDTQLGVVEIGAEATTRDSAVEEFSMGPAFELRYALNPASVLFGTTRASGVTTAVVSPRAANDPLAGTGLAISLRDTLDPSALILSDRLAMFGGVGPKYASYVGGSRGALVVRLREALTAAKRFNPARYTADDNGYTSSDMAALKRWLSSGAPLALEVNQASQILQAIALADEFDLELIVIGGVEGWKVARELAAAEVPVVLDPMDNIPIDFDRLGARLDNAALLNKAGVTIAFRSENTHNAGWIRQGGGIAVANGLPFAAAIAAITSAPAEIWGLKGRGSIARGNVADLVLWSGDPLEVTTHAEQVMIDGVWMSLDSRQERLLERYRDIGNTVTPYGFR